MPWMAKPVAKSGAYHWVNEIEEIMASAKPARAGNLLRLVVLLVMVVLISLLIARVLSITDIWNTVIMRPMLNLLILMSKYFLGSFGIAVIVLTILIRLLTLPLTMRQLRSAKTSHAIQPKIRELQKRYVNDKDKLGQEIIKLYSKSGHNPLGCVVPTLIQFPIWVALYQSVAQALAYTPENLVGLDKQLYSLTVLKTAVPMNSHFSWLDLTRGDTALAFLVAGSAWMVQKMASPPTADPRQRWLNRIMMWALPLIFGFFAFTLPSGLSLYWLTANIIGIIIQYRVTGWGTLKMPSLALLKRGGSRPVYDPSAKSRGAASTEKKAAEDSARQRDIAKAHDASSKKKDV